MLKKPNLLPKEAQTKLKLKDSVESHAQKEEKLLFQHEITKNKNFKNPPIIKEKETQIKNVVKTPANIGNPTHEKSYQKALTNKKSNQPVFNSQNQKEKISYKTSEKPNKTTSTSFFQNKTNKPLEVINRKGEKIIKSIIKPTSDPVDLKVYLKYIEFQ